MAASTLLAQPAGVVHFHIVVMEARWTLQIVFHHVVMIAAVNGDDRIRIRCRA
jgi:hypothetical protein